MAPIVPPATKLLFEVRVEPDNVPRAPTDPSVFGQLDPKLRKSPLTCYGLLYMLPQSQITFTNAGHGSYTGALEFEIAAFDLDGKLVTVLSETLNISLTNDDYRQFIQTPFKFFQRIDLPPGQFQLRAGVRDTVSNKIGTVEIPLAVSKNR
jgi:hypothetical protein